ncbi:MAG: terminase [Burkholderiaceae bacterium]
MTADEARELECYLTPEEREELYALVAQDMAECRWLPLPPKGVSDLSPQAMAWASLADITGYGGAAGGGKTDLIAGLVQDGTRHERALIVRREKAQTDGVVQRLTEIIGHTDGHNSQKSVWRIPGGALTEFAGLDNPGDERRWQGRPHDLKAFDEVTEQREHQVRFVMGWTRTNNPNLRARVLMTFNPPTTDEGRWVIAFFGPWLDKTHPLYPTPYGALRWCAMLPDGRGNSKDRWVANGEPFVLVDGEPCYEFDPDDYAPEDIIRPKSRTFIPARVTDNPYYMATGYMSVLQSLPEPLRSQMLYGDFQAGVTDDPWQLLPTAWVEAAQARWKPRAPRGEMLAMGVDVARGGKDNTVIVARHRDDQAGHDRGFAPPQIHPGTETPDGPAVAGLVVAGRRNDAPVQVDVIGVGASPYDTLNGMGVQVMGVNVSEKTPGTDKSGRLTFVNLRSQLGWALREALDPANDTGIALPPEEVAPGLRRELCTPKWGVHGMQVWVESREDIITRLKKSPDMFSAIALANMDVPKRGALEAAGVRDQVTNYNPLAAMRR